jgi:curved DNA-binding protein CbpA
MTPSLLPYTPDRDAYRLLGVPPSASLDEINTACRRLARTFHPDRNGSARATQEMQVVNDVRRLMTDPAERARYDWERRRFHRELIRPALAHLQARAPMDRRHGRPARTSRSRYLRATLVGLRAALAGLAPSRCRGCRTVVASVDIYCAACGTPRLTGC